MRRGVRWAAGLAVAAGLSCLASQAQAGACATQGSTAARTIAIHDPGKGMPLLVQLGLWIPMLGADFGDSLGKQGEACERLRFSVRGYGYVLRGDEDLSALPRVAVPNRKGGPVVYLTPVPDIGATRVGGTAPTAGYALVTYADGAHTVWAIYDAIPADKALRNDISTVLAGRARAVMEVRGSKVRLFMPGGGK